MCGANGTGCTFGGELYGGGRCSFQVAVWRLHNGRCFGTGLGFFTCRTLLLGCQILVMGVSIGLKIEVCFFGMAIYADLGLAFGYLEKTVGAEVEMELVVEVVMEVALTVVCRWVKVVLNGGSYEGGLQVGESGVGALDKLAWWFW